MERISSLFSYEITDGYQTILDYWHGSITKPEIDIAFEGLMSMANSIHFDSCRINTDLVRALVDSTYNLHEKPFVDFSPFGLLPAQIIILVIREFHIMITG